MNGKLLWLAHRLTAWMPESSAFGLRNALYRLAGVKLGNRVRIYSSARILGTGSVEIGDDVHLGPDVLIYTNQQAKVGIGSHVDIAPRVAILTGSHELTPAGEHMAGPGTAKDVRVGDGCWIGAGATLLGGVELKERTVVAAGSVVVKGCNQGQCLLAGVPAQLKKIYS